MCAFWNQDKNKFVIFGGDRGDKIKEPSAKSFEFEENSVDEFEIGLKGYSPGQCVVWDRKVYTVMITYAQNEYKRHVVRFDLKTRKLETLLKDIHITF